MGTVSPRLIKSIEPNWAPYAPIAKDVAKLVSKRKMSTIWHFPTWPADAFAACALLLDRSGVYSSLEPHYFEADPLSPSASPNGNGSPYSYKFRWGYIGRFNRNYYYEGDEKRPDGEPRGMFDKRTAIPPAGPTPEDNESARAYARRHRYRLPPISDDKWVADYIDPCGVLGENQLEIRLAGAMWAFGIVALVDDDDRDGPTNQLLKHRGADESSLDDYMRPLYYDDFQRLPATLRSGSDQLDDTAAHSVGRLYRKVEACLDFLNANYSIKLTNKWDEIANEVRRGYRKLCQQRQGKPGMPSPRSDLDLRKMYTSSESGHRLEVSGRHISRLYNLLPEISAAIRGLDTAGYKDFIRAAGIPRTTGGGKAAREEAQKKIDDLFTLVRWGIDYIQARWTYLLLSKSDVSADLKMTHNSVPPDWCAPAFRLLLIADEAAVTIGFGEIVDQNNKTEKHCTTPLKWMHLTRKMDRQNNLEREEKAHPTRSYAAGDDGRAQKLSDWDLPRQRLYDRKITVTFGDDYGTVLPKARTSQVGCTLRSFSHNLAYLPTKGRVRARWLGENRTYKREHLRSTVQLLLLPYPFAVRSTCFREADVSSEHTAHSINWGEFHVDQEWLKPIGDYSTGTQQESHKGLEGLLHLILNSVDLKLDGLVLPEFSVNAKTYLGVSDYLLKNTDARFMVAGAGLENFEDIYPARRDLEGAEKNFGLPLQNSVIIAADPRRNGSPSWDIEWARRKHHAWKLDARQLKRYAISHRLDPSKSWWEALEIKNREIGFVEYHQGSLFTALICEDLARIEPAQVAIRSIGPNLVFVLLMDAAQKAERWSNQYAGVLADEPGCSVLTMTCMGMVKRSNASENGNSTTFALWRDPTNLEEIKLPAGYHAVNITLRAEHVNEHTRDGRMDTMRGAVTWKLAGVNPIRIREDEMRRRGISFYRNVPDKLDPQPIGLKEFLSAFGYDE